MKLVLIINFVFLFDCLKAQIIESRTNDLRNEKIVIENNKAYIFDAFIQEPMEFFQIPHEGINPSIISKYFKPKNQFTKQPFNWDVIDDCLIQLRLSYDPYKITRGNLVYFGIGTLKKIYVNGAERSAIYFNDKERFLLTDIGPFDRYYERIYYKSDTLKGDLYFDFLSTKDTFLYYIYIDASKIIEEWALCPAPLGKGVRPSDLNRVGARPWKRLHSWPINLDSPFWCFGNGSKNYLVTESGEIYEINKKEITNTDVHVNLRGKFIIINKDKGGLQIIDKQLLKDINKISFALIIQNAETIFNFN